MLRCVLRFARDHLDDPEEDWKNVMWSVLQYCNPKTTYPLWPREWKRYDLELLFWKGERMTDLYSGRDKCGHVSRVFGQTPPSIIERIEDERWLNILEWQWSTDLKAFQGCGIDYSVSGPQSKRKAFEGVESLRWPAAASKRTDGSEKQPQFANLPTTYMNHLTSVITRVTLQRIEVNHTENILEYYGFFFLLLSLIVEMCLWWTLKTFSFSSFLVRNL